MVVSRWRLGEKRREYSLAGIVNNANSIMLPQWIDRVVYDELGGRYCPRREDMLNINDDYEQTINYLGTYFPRSYAEAYFIWRKILAENELFHDRNMIRVFDFGCGTGGEVIGMADAINDCLPQVEIIDLVAFDGNHYALQTLQRIISRHIERGNCPNIILHSIPFKVDDFYDLTVLTEVIESKYRQFDCILTFKAVCEFVNRRQFEQKNAYRHIIDTFTPFLGSAGMMLIEDITTYSDVDEKWLPTMMDEGIRGTSLTLQCRNEGYNVSVRVSHSRRNLDTSKVAWRLLKR